MFTEHYNFSRYFIFTKQTLFDEPLTVKIASNNDLHVFALICFDINRIICLAQIFLLLQIGFSQAQS